MARIDPHNHIPQNAVVQFGAMIHATIPVGVALGALAKAFHVSTVAIARAMTQDGMIDILAQNETGHLEPATRPILMARKSVEMLTLGGTQPQTDFLVLASAHHIKEDTRAAAEAALPFMAAQWMDRPSAFDTALEHLQSVPDQSILHPDNPFGLTPSELRICALIASGQRPAMMVQTLKASMPTVRTHLRNIYIKTGLDGMHGVLNHMRATASLAQAAE